MTTTPEIWIKFRRPLIYLFIILFGVLFYLLDMIQLDVYSIKIKSDMKLDLDNKFLIKTAGCRIPFLDPWDKTILKYVYKVKPFRCGAPPLVNSNRNEIFIDLNQLGAYNVSNITNLDCCYKPFWRKNPTANTEDILYKYGKCEAFDLNATINDEFVQITCKLNDFVVYKDYHSFVPVKKVIPAKNLNEKLNVIIIGMDAISRLNFQRQLPLTKAYLTKKLHAIELIGYNKVGDNTFPNLIPILTGQSEDELSANCWHTTRTKFDNCSFIWKNYSANGYLTAYAEDAAWMGVFNYVKRGFNQQPTDYYWRTFSYLAEKHIGHTTPYNAKLCLGSRPVYTVLLDYILKFVHSLSGRRYFGFFWGTSLSHDNLNYPAQGDENYQTFFANLHNSQNLNQTALIVLSDHGIRWGEIRSTHQGHLEERLPFLYLAFPDWFNRKYPSAMANLRRNSRRLTTPYDLHETLVDLLNLNRLSTDNIKRRTVNKRGISLFLEIPENRTCKSANIAPHWCTCQQSVKIEKNNTMIIKAADFVINRMNYLLRGYKSCAKLRLDSIVDSRLLKSEDYLKNNSTIQDYIVIVKTQPGGGLFEATVRCVFCDRFEPFDLTGTISRLNLYGKQSACITDFHLKLYCYCVS